jgi:hypothetical protein
MNNQPFGQGSVRLRTRGGKIRGAVDGSCLKRWAIARLAPELQDEPVRLRAIGSRRWMLPHEDQVRQVAEDCRNPLKAEFSHLLRSEGTSGTSFRIGDTAKRGGIRCLFKRRGRLATENTEITESEDKTRFCFQQNSRWSL